MTKLLSSLMLLVWISSCSNSDVHGKYKFHCDSFGEVASESSFTTFEIMTDGTFEYKHRAVSCLLWNDRAGEWLVDGDTLVMTEMVDWEDEALIDDEYQNRESQDLVKILVVDENNKPISNAHLEYDITHIQDSMQKDSTNDKGVVTFKRIEVEKGRYANRVLLFLEFENDTADVFTMLMPRLSSNHITIKIYPEPVPIVFKRVSKYLYSKDTLVGLYGSFNDEGSVFLKVDGKGS